MKRFFNALFECVCFFGIAYCIVMGIVRLVQL